ncbi:MAG: 50S ribosomal protein L10 [Desulfatibacillaceae bacterium]
MKKEDKEKVVANLHERAKRARLAVITEFRGLNVDKMNLLRTSLREASVEYQVVKNTLLSRAAKGTDLELLKDEFSGPNALALAYDDPVEPARVLTKFAKDNDKFVIKSAMLAGKVMTRANLEALSKLPPRDVLQSQLLGTMQSVPGSFVRALADAPRRMLNVLNARKDSLDEAA